MQEIWVSIYPFLVPIYTIGLVMAVISLLLENKNPLKTHSYLLLLLLLPVIGILIYFFFGQNMRKRKIFKKRKLINQAFGQQYIDDFLDNRQRLEVPNEFRPLEQYDKLIRFLAKDLSPLSINNRVSILRNGEEKFPAVMEAIKNAQHHIHLEYYIFNDDSIGGPLSELLIKKAQEGVKVRIIVDGVGSLGLKRRYFKKMIAGGIDIHEFMPVLFPAFTSKINYRNHRKIIVIDGKIGFTGGINIDDRYINNGKHSLYWRDTHLKLEGEVVKTLQFLFMLSWQFITKEELPADNELFPEFEHIGRNCIQINASGPDWELASIMDSFLLAINAAHSNVRIITPYFIPTESIMDAITTVARSGIDIEIMMPYESDSRIVQAASMSYIKNLLRAGVKVHLYKKGFIHAKVIMVDDTFASVGTTNMDNRSFNMNYEVNTYIYDKAIVKTLISQFQSDKQESIRVDLERWKKRKALQKLKESVCRLLAPLL